MTGVTGTTGPTRAADPPVRAGLSRAVAWILLGLAVTGTVLFAVRVGPDLVGAWRDPEPDAGLVKFVTAAMLVIVLGAAGTLLLSAWLVSRGRSRTAQIVGADLALLVGVLTLLGGYAFRGGAFDSGDSYGRLAMVGGGVLVGCAATILWPARS